MDQPSQFLPLDSGFISQKCIGTDVSSVLTDSQNQISFLINKIAQVQKNYMCIEAKYQRKIKQLKAQLSQKHKDQATLCTQLALLAKQYQNHKGQIQKISEGIKRSIQNQTNSKQKSKSPKNNLNSSTKRLIKKSLQIDGRQLQKKELVKIQKLNESNTINSLNKDRQNLNQICKNNHEEYIKNKTLPDITEKQGKKLNESQTSKKELQIQKKGITTNGPSPKKNILFNSSKELDIFNPKNKPVKLNVNTIFGIGASRTKKTNSSPMGLKKKLSQKQTTSNNVTNNGSISQQIEKNNPLKQAIIHQQTKEQHKHQKNLIADQNSNKNQVKKSSSPTNANYLKKKLYSPDNNGNKKISSPIRPVRQIKQPYKQVSVKYTIKISPSQSTQVKSPKKLINNSPTHKKAESNKDLPNQSQKKGFGKLRQKLHIPF